MMIVRNLLVAAALVAVAAPALALPQDVSDPFGAAPIAQGRHSAVEPLLFAAYTRGDRRPEVLLNLAAVRLKEGNGGAAGELYREVLDQPNVDMATLNGSAWSHDIAKLGLTLAGR